MFRILVTGACGFIGYQTILALSQRSDVQILGVDNLKPFHATTLSVFRYKSLRELGFQVDLLNLLDEESLSVRRIGKVDLVLHLAAFPGVRVTKEQEAFVYQNNVGSFRRVLSYASSASAPLIYASSSSVYGDLATKGACKEAFFPDFKGKGIYALSKWQNEIDAMEEVKKGGQALGLRLFSVFGKYGREDMAYFKFARAIKDKVPIQIFDSMEHERDYTPISIVLNDFEQLIEMALLEPKEFTSNFFGINSLPILNIGSGTPRSLANIIAFYGNFFGIQPEIEITGRLDMECQKTWSDNTKRNQFLKDRENIDFYEELAEFASWVRDFWPL